MKRRQLIKSLVIGGMILTMAGCKSQSKPEDTKSSTEAVTETETPSNEQPTKPEEEQPTEATEDETEEVKAEFICDGEPIDGGYYQSPDVMIQFQRPLYQSVSGRGMMYVQRNKKLFIAYNFGSDSAGDVTNNLDDIFDRVIDEFIRKYEIQTMVSYESKYEVTSSEKMTINGCDCIRYTFELSGKTQKTSTTTRNRTCVMYTFVYNDIANWLAAVNVSDDQDQALTDEMTHNIDEMMKTIEPFVR